jgi:hypothetical protein
MMALISVIYEKKWHVSDVLLLIVMFYVLFMCKCVLPPGVKPIAVDKHINIKLSYPLFPLHSEHSDAQLWYIPCSPTAFIC